MPENDSGLRRLATFSGVVSCRRDPGRPLGLTLQGQTGDHPDEPLSLTFAGVAPEDLPPRLDGAVVEEVGHHRYRISSPPRQWIIDSGSVHQHRDIAASFYRAVPPRVPPLKKRLFWRVVLVLAGNPAGKRLLLALRR